MKINEFRQRVHALLTEPETADLPDEEWYDRLWELLDPVIDARAHRAPDDVHTHDAGDYHDPETGKPVTFDRELERHRFEFEGATSQLARHLVEEHDVLPGTVEPYAGGMTQGAWVALDDLHRAAHERGV